MALAAALSACEHDADPQGQASISPSSATVEAGRAFKFTVSVTALDADGFRIRDAPLVEVGPGLEVEGLNSLDKLVILAGWKAGGSWVDVIVPSDPKVRARATVDVVARPELAPSLARKSSLSAVPVRVAWSADGSQVLAVHAVPGYAETRVYDGITGVRGADLDASASARSPDGTRLATVRARVPVGEVAIFGPGAEDAPLRFGELSGSDVAAMRWPDAQQLWIASGSGRIQVWNLDTVRPTELVIDPFLAGVFRPGAPQFAYAPAGLVGRDVVANTLLLADLGFKQLIGKVTLQRKGVQDSGLIALDPSFSADGSKLAVVVVSGNGTQGVAGPVNVWHLDTGGVSEVGEAPDLTAAAIAPDGTQVALGSRQGVLRVVALASGEELWSVPNSAGIQRLAYTPDGGRIAGVVGTSIRVWDTHDRKIVW